MFESSPFIACPRCSENSFGVLRIEMASYDRRCAACGYPRGTNKTATYWLPELKKRLVYLDQSVLSNFMKALNPKAGRLETIDPKWKALFSQIDVLVKLQAVVCPDSDVHRAESIVYEYGEDVKRIYELLSHGVTFYDSDRTWFNQHRALFNAFIKGSPAANVNFELNDSVPESVHAWQEKIIITANLPSNPYWIELHKAQKKRNHEQLSVLFETWRKEPKRDFHYWFAIEIAEATRLAKRRFEKPMLKIAKMHFTHNVEASNAVSQYFESDFPSMAIQSRIDCALFASLAHKANHGMKRLKDEGVMNDFRALSITLPYCDAVAVDRQTAGLLRDVPNGILNFRARVFSNSEIEDFSDYLAKIHDSLPAEHLKKVCEVYGDDFGKPYLTVFEDN